MKTFSFFLAAACAACVTFTALAEEQIPASAAKAQAAKTAADPQLSAEFAAVCTAKVAAVNQAAPAADQAAADKLASVVQGSDGWLFAVDELAQLGSLSTKTDATKTAGPTRPPFPGATSAIIRYKKQLAMQGIQLIVVPVPDKALVYADKLSEKFAAENGVPRLDAAYQRFYTELEAQGTTVLDLLPAFLAARKSNDGPLFHKQSSRLTPVGCIIAAQEIAKLLKNADWYEEIRKYDYQTQEKTIERLGELAAELQDKPAPEKLHARCIAEKQGNRLTPVRSPGSTPVILLGSDALIDRPRLMELGAGLFDQLAYECGFAPALFTGKNGNAARYALYKRLRRETRLLKEKRAVVWCFSTNELTAGDWLQIDLK